MRYEHRIDHDGRAICSVLPCRETIPWNAPAPVCRAHGIEIAKEYADVLRSLENQKRKAYFTGVESRKPAEMRLAGREVVYYVRIGSYIKIGYTRRLQQRIRQLRADFEDLLAVEDGNRDLESERHHQFRSDRLDMRRENFQPSPALMAHIEDMGGRDSLPDWARRPDTGRIRRRSASDQVS